MFPPDTPRFSDATLPSVCSCRRVAHRRQGGILIRLLAAIGVIAILAVIAAWVWAERLQVKAGAPHTAPSSTVHSNEGVLHGTDFASSAKPESRSRSSDPRRMVAAVYMGGQPPIIFPKDLPSKQNGRIGRPVPTQVLQGDLSTSACAQIDSAKAAGIDAFAIWMHPRMGNSPTAQSYQVREWLELEALFAEMKKTGGFSFYPDYWWYRMDPVNWGNTEKSWKRDPDPGVEAEMRDHGKLLQSWAERFGDVWAKKDGRLVVGMQDHALFANVPYAKAMEWLFSPLGGRDKVYLVLSRYPTHGTIAADWLAGADAICDWDANRTYGDSLHVLKAGKAFAQAQGKAWWPSFAPSFFQSRTGDSTAPISPLVYERLGIIAYRRAWLDAILGDVPTVYLITWNDVSEDSEIMPTDLHREAHQRLTRFFSSWYKTGTQPAIQQEELLLFHHPQVVSGLQLPPGRLPTVGPEGGLTPPTDYIAICSFLKTPAEVSVVFQKEVVATKKLPAGFQTWLLYNPAVPTPGASAPIYPAEEEGLIVTVLNKPFKDMEVLLQVTRDGVDMGRFFSHHPIVDAAGRADLGTVGNVFSLTH